MFWWTCTPRSLLPFFPTHVLSAIFPEAPYNLLVSPSIPRPCVRMLNPSSLHTTDGTFPAPTLPAPACPAFAGSLSVPISLIPLMLEPLFVPLASTPGFQFQTLIKILCTSITRVLHSSTSPPRIIGHSFSHYTLLPRMIVICMGDEPFRVLNCSTLLGKRADRGEGCC